MNSIKIDTLNDEWANNHRPGFNYALGVVFIAHEEHGDGKLIVNVDTALCRNKDRVACSMCYVIKDGEVERSYEVEVSPVRPGLMYLDALKACAKAFNEALSGFLGVKVEVTEGGVA